MSTFSDDKSGNPTRREVIKTGAAVTGAAAISSTLLGANASAAPMIGASIPMGSNGLPTSNIYSDIKHIVVLMMENRSFDHVFGWLPGANGVQAGRMFADNYGNIWPSHNLTKFQNCESNDPDHSYVGGRAQISNGAMDGFLKTASLTSTGVPDTLPIGYYTGAQLPFNEWAGRNWTVCDTYHCAMLTSTFPNRQYMHCGHANKTDNFIDLFASITPNIWTITHDAGLSARYYYSDLDFSAAIGFFFNNYPKGTVGSTVNPVPGTFFYDVATGNLPAVSYVDPRFDLDGATGTSSDDHPLADIRDGQVFMNAIYTALAAAPTWQNTLLIINYDEWGGFADHVAPPLAPVSQQEATISTSRGGPNLDATIPQTVPGATPYYARLGVRVPCMLIGPRARRSYVAHSLYDHNSVLNFISWNFGLPYLGIRGTGNNHGVDESGNIGTALDWSKPYGEANKQKPAPIPVASHSEQQGALFSFNHPTNGNFQFYGNACANNEFAINDDVRARYAPHFAEIAEIKRLNALTPEERLALKLTKAG
jgi:phospholipase C